MKQILFQIQSTLSKYKFWRWILDILSIAALSYVFYKVMIWAASIDDSEKTKLPSTYEEAVFRLDQYQKNDFKGRF